MPEHASNATDAEANMVRRWGGRVPIVIGAIGHRNIRPADGKLAAAIRNECRKLKRQYGASPFIVLSALAEGADRLIARIAMEEVGADLIAVLPMPAADYERDFQTDDSKREFREFLNSAACVKTAAVPEGAAWKADGEPRNEQYARAGAIIADHSHIFFAIWDGKPARGIGGTAEQVAWFERGHSPREYSLYNYALSPLITPEPGLKIQLDPATAQVSFIEHPQARERKGYMQSILLKTNKYNRDVLQYRNASTNDVHFPGRSVGKELDVTGNTHSKADELATYFSKQSYQFEQAIYYLAMISILSVNFVSETYYAAWLYFGLSLAIAILSAHVWLTSSKTRSMEDRCLAEAMRTLFFWRLAGVTRPVWLAYQSRQPGLVHWISYAVRALEFCQDCRVQTQLKQGNGLNSSAVRLAKVHWIDDQKGWLLRREREHLHRFAFLKWTSRIAIAASFATAAVLAIFTLATAANGGSLWDVWVKPYGSFWQVVLALFAAVELSARDKSIHLDLAKRYASQRQVFETASRMLDTMVSNPQLQGDAVRILEELGEIVLREQEEWLWLTHTRTSA